MEPRSGSSGAIGSASPDVGGGEGKFDMWAATYDHSQLQQYLYQPVHQAVLGYARPHARDAAVLDIGCGTGRLLFAADQCFPRARLVGIDASAEMLKQAVNADARRSSGHRHAIQFLHARAEQLPFRTGTFDLIFSTLSMQHWHDQAKGLHELKRIMKLDEPVARQAP